MDVLWFVVALALGAGGGWFARGLRDDEPAAKMEQLLTKARADQLVDFLQRVNEQRDPSTAALVRGIVWDLYGGRFREYIDRQVKEHPTRPDRSTGPNP